MKYLLVIPPLVLLSFLSAASVSADTNINISNNADGSDSNVSVHSSTDSNSTSSNTSSVHNHIEINGKTYVDDTQNSDSDTSTDITVHKEGDAEPTIEYTLRKGSVTLHNDSAKPTLTPDEIKKKITDQKAKVEAKIKEQQEKQQKEQSAFAAWINSFFDHFKDLFSH